MGMIVKGFWLGVLATALAFSLGLLLVMVLAAYAVAGGQPAATFVDDAVLILGGLWASGMALSLGAVALGIVLGALGFGRD